MSLVAQSAAAPTFRHGIHPSERKDATASRAIERVPFVEEYVLPLSQHIGAPAKAIVKVGAEVQRGELIAAAGGFVSCPLHAPVTGRVTALELRPHPSGKMLPAIVITADPYSDQKMPPSAPLDIESLSAQEIVKKVQESGLVGLGGAAFPTHVKFAVPDGKRVDCVIINGCECEPYLTCDHRVMLERPEAVLRGTQIAMRLVGAERAVIGIEANKPDAVAALQKLAPKNISIITLQVKYPQGAEKMLISAALGREVPSGGLPLDIHFLVNNVGTTAALADWFDAGIPLIERVVTVTGSGVRQPRNLLVPLGTPVKVLLDYCGGLKPNVRQMIMGGPMMGMAQKQLGVPVLKGTSGLLVLTDENVVTHEEYACIRCSRCLEACPMFLNPTRLALLARAGRVADLAAYHAMDCFECASCSYVCPSNIPLVQWIRMGKAQMREAAAREKAAAAKTSTA